MNNEEWRDVVGYEGIYEVSNMGNVRNKKTLRVRKPFISYHNYVRVPLRKNNKSKNFSIHRLVAEAFIPNPENKETVNHINGDKTDNRVENLEWCTYEENSIKSIEQKLNLGGIKKRVRQYDENGKLLNIWTSVSEAGRATKTIKRNISACCYYNSKHSNKRKINGYIWEFDVA